MTPSNAEGNQTSNSVDVGASKVNSLANAELREAIGRIWAGTASQAMHLLRDDRNPPSKVMALVEDVVADQILALIQAREQQLLTELIGELPESVNHVSLDTWNEGFNSCRKQVVSVIAKYREGL